MRQPKDPFGGAADWEPKPKRARKITTTAPKTRKAKPFLARAEAISALKDIQQTAEAALARLSMFELGKVRNDFEWIRDLADDGRRAG